jgi:hypothetical protein
MSDATQTSAIDVVLGSVSARPQVLQGLWWNGLVAAASWAAAALVTIGLPDVVPWGSAGLFAALTGGGAACLLPCPLSSVGSAVSAKACCTSVLGSSPSAYGWRCGN